MRIKGDGRWQLQKRIGFSRAQSITNRDIGQSFGIGALRETNDEALDPSPRLSTAMRVLCCQHKKFVSESL